MAESTVAVESDLILPYRFEPEGEWGSSEGTDDDSDHSDDSQASGLATPRRAAARTALLYHAQSSVTAVERCQR